MIFTCTNRKERARERIGRKLKVSSAHRRGGLSAKEEEEGVVVVVVVSVAKRHSLLMAF